jgi:putative tricarboxylic transport membrane protein
MGARNYQTIGHVCLGLLGLGICAHSIVLKLGTPANPGAGFMPFGTGFLSLILSAAGLFKRESEKGGERLQPHLGRIAAIVAGLVGYGLILTTAGFLVATFLLMTFLFAIAGNKNWIRIIIKALVSSVVTYLVFARWLGCELPRGIFGF